MQQRGVREQPRNELNGTHGCLRSPILPECLAVQRLGVRSPRQWQPNAEGKAVLATLGEPLSFFKKSVRRNPQREVKMLEIVNIVEAGCATPPCLVGLALTEYIQRPIPTDRNEEAIRIPSGTCIASNKEEVCTVSYGVFPPGEGIFFSLKSTPPGEGN